MKRTLSILAGVLGLAVLLWALSQDRDEPEPTLPGADEALGTQEQAPVLEAGAQKTTPVAVPSTERTGPGRIEGTVLLEGRPTAARVEVRELRYAGGGQESLLCPPYSTGPLVGEAQAGSDGSFQIHGLAIASYEIHALSADGYTVWQRASLRPRQQHLKLSLHLLGGASSLQGRAVYADDRPFRGVVWASLGTQSLRQVETDETGRFVLNGLPTGKVALSFVVPEKVHYRFVRVPVPQEGETLFVVDEGLLQLEGRVVADDDGTPLPAVRMSWDSGGIEEKRVIAVFETDEDGFFTCLVPAHKGIIWARKEGFATIQYSYSEERGLQLRLKRRGTITGQVLRKDTQAPIPGIAVHGWSWYSYDMPRPLARTEADGTFSCLAGPGKGMVYVLGDVWVSESLRKATDRSRRTSVVEVGQGGTTEVVLEVIRTASVRGTVTGAGGKPAAGVQLQLMHPPRWTGFNHLVFLAPKDVPLTSSDGTYEVTGLIPGFPYLLRALPADGLPATSQKFSAASGACATVDLQLVEGVALKIQILEQGTSAPIEGVQVWGGQAGQSFNGTSDEQGLVDLGTVLLRPYHLRLRHPGYLQPSGTSGAFGGARSTFPAPQAGAGPRVIELERGYRFRGRLLGADGAPWTEGGGLGVHVSGERVGRSLGLCGRMPLGVDGTFDLGPVPAGSYDLILHRGKTNRLLTRWSVRTGQGELTLRIDSAQGEADGKKQVVIIGTDASGQPVTGWLRVSAADDSFQELKKMLAGTYPCDNARAGDVVWLHFFRMKSADGTDAGSSYQGPLTLKAGENHIQLPAPLSIRGRVQDGDEKPIAGILLQFMPLAPEGAPAIASTFAMPAARSKPDGSFFVTGLGAGPHRLLVSAPAEYGMSPPLRVEAGQQGVSIQLEGAEAVALTIRGSEGAALIGAILTVTVPGTGAVLLKRTAVTDDAGIAKLEGLAQRRTYLLQVDPPAVAEGLASYWAPAWTPQDGALTLPQGRRIEGHLQHGAGPASPHSIWWKDARDRWQRVRSSPTGRFSMTALRGSPVSLRVAPRWSESVAEGGAPTLVPADQTSITLKLR